jgi:prepilin-type N-terminal cleavage/methylation domain-containing protein
MNLPVATLRLWPGNRRGGFTLIEVIMAMLIFVMLAAAVFGILGSVLQASSTLQDSQNRREQVEALQAFLQHQLRGISAGDTIVSYQRGDGEGLKLNGMLWGNASLASVLDAKIQPNGYYQLRFARLSEANLDPNNAATQSNPIPFLVTAVQSDEATISWVPLIHDVRQVGWRFQGQVGTPWVDNWNSANPSNNPSEVEFTLQVAGDTQPTVMDFWITTLQPVPAAPGLPAATTTNPSPP